MVVKYTLYTFSQTAFGCFKQTSLDGEFQPFTAGLSGFGLVTIKIRPKRGGRRTVWT